VSEANRGARNLGERLQEANRLMRVKRPERSESATWQAIAQSFFALEGKKKARSAFLSFFILKNNAFSIAKKFCLTTINPKYIRLLIIIIRKNVQNLY